MKKLIIGGVLVCTSLCASAQDVIVKKDGSTILSKVLEVNETNIKYKKFSNKTGPTYTIGIENVLSVNYENGEKETFDNTSLTVPKKEGKSTVSTSAVTPSQQYVQKEPANNNHDLIQCYNQEIRFTTKYKDKASKWFFPVMAVSDSSLVSTDELEMRFVPVTIYNQKYGGVYELRYYIELENKTNNIIYVDLANTFKIFTDGDSKTYFSTDQVSVSQGTSTGVGIGLGGIAGALGIGGTLGTLAGSVSVGGSSQSGVTTTYNQQRILAIPPHSTKNLSEFKQVHVKKKEYKTISDAELWHFYLFGQRGFIKKGQINSYTEDTTPYTNRYIITYSTTQDFSTYSTLNTKVYARYIVGEDINVTYCYNRERLTKGVAKFIPDFGTNPCILVGVDSYLSK